MKPSLEGIAEDNSAAISERGSAQNQGTMITPKNANRGYPVPTATSEQY